tara:strand:+ start:11489 stop:12157 length:669 start_codon:yes stop_codon:yes gene_type:complete
MKKLITLLLVLVSLNSYSQNDSVIAYYKEITEDIWVTDKNTNEWVKDSTQQWKWNEDVYIHVWGDKKDFIISELKNIVKELNELIEPINIYVTDDTLKRNCRLFIGSGKEYYNINPYYKDYIDIDGIKPFGFANQLGGTKFINAGLSFVDTEYILEFKQRYGWDDVRFNEEVKSTLREEITQMLGFSHDSYKYPNSIFQESKYFPVTQYSEIDKEIIKMLYN